MSELIKFKITPKREKVGEFEIETPDGVKSFDIYTPNAKQTIQYQKVALRLNKLFGSSLSATEENIDALIPFIQEFLQVAVPETKDFDFAEILDIEQYMKLAEFMNEYLKLLNPKPETTSEDVKEEPKPVE